MSIPTTLTAAAEWHELLELLLLERALAAIEDLSDCPEYAEILEREIAEARVAYVGAAVLEIASLRAELSGRLAG